MHQSALQPPCSTAHCPLQGCHAWAACPPSCLVTLLPAPVPAGTWTCTAVLRLSPSHPTRGVVGKSFPFTESLGAARSHQPEHSTQQDKALDFHQHHHNLLQANGPGKPLETTALQPVFALKSPKWQQGGDCNLDFASPRKRACDVTPAAFIDS